MQKDLHLLGRVNAPKRLNKHDESGVDKGLPFSFNEDGLSFRAMQNNAYKGDHAMAYKVYRRAM